MPIIVPIEVKMCLNIDCPWGECRKAMIFNNNG
nr:MAG TPA: hypothetical protein [Caudoviricetes sp.]